jgi:hypothetical protein
MFLYEGTLQNCIESVLIGSEYKFIEKFLPGKKSPALLLPPCVPNIIE